MTQHERRTAHIGRKPFVLRTSYFVLLLLLLGACGFTTDTAATVGNERITMGELNAAAGRLGPEGDRRQALDQLIDSRLLELEARSRNVTVSDAEIRERMNAIRGGFDTQIQQQQGQALDRLAATTAQALRPTINPRGGANLPDNDLRALVRDELGRMGGQLDAHQRDQTIARDVPEGLVRGHADSLANALRGRGVDVAAGDLESALADAAGQLIASRADTTGQLGSALTRQGIRSGNEYRALVREELLAQKMRPLYLRPVDAITVQRLTTDTQDKAREALGRARAGTPFNELVQQYAVEGAKSEQTVNVGSVAVQAVDPAQLKAIFPQFREGDPASLKAGDCSEIQTVRGAGGAPNFQIYCIARVERREPAGQNEEAGLRRTWINGLRDKYPVRINPDLDLNPAAGGR